MGHAISVPVRVWFGCPAIGDQASSTVAVASITRKP
jgi:hypothetical protein